MKKILLISLILLAALCGMARMTDGGVTLNRNAEWAGDDAPCIPCNLWLTSAPGTDNQIACINTPITNITYSTSAQVQEVTFSGLPAGVTGTYNAQAHVATISGTPSESGTYSYSATASGACSQAFRTGSITVRANATIILTTEPGTTNQTVCINTSITGINYTIGGGGSGAGVTGLPPGVNGLYHPTPHVFQISGTPAVAGTFNYTVTTTGMCVQAIATGTITVNPDATITLTSEPGTTNQTVCINTPVTNISYAIGGGGTGTGITGLPPGIAGVYNAGMFTICGTPTGAGTFNYTVTTTGSCVQATATGTIVVHSDATITLNSESWTTDQTVCINTPVTSITYLIGGGGTGAEVTGLPPGIMGSYLPSLHLLSIHGTPTQAGTFNYTVTTTGMCAQATATGTITVNPDATITLTSEPWTTTQTLCINTPITSINYSIGGGGTGAGVTGLPPGIAGVYNAGVFTISGTPTGAGTFNYTVTTTGACPQTATGSIVVRANSTITLTSEPWTTNQAVCINTSITSINYSIGGTGTGAGVTGLPPGVSGLYYPTPHVFQIHGTPTQVGTFNYTITSTGACPLTATGTITVNPDATITLTSEPWTTNQIVCMNTPIANITYSIAGGGTIAMATGLPPGIWWMFNTGVFTISGVPTEAGSFNYSVVTTDICSQTVTGTIMINPESTITLTSGEYSTHQSVCINTPLPQKIKYSIGGTSTEVGVTGLPQGVNGDYDTIQHLFLIDGIPTQEGNFTYTVTATGNCAPKIATGTITVTPDATLILVSEPGSDSQSACIGVDIQFISYSYGGASGGSVTGLPPGVYYNNTWWDVTIYGKPTETGTFIYTVTTTGTCPEKTATGTITVNPETTLTLTSAPGTDSQHACIDVPITNINYSISGSETSVTVSGLPPGVTGVFYNVGVFIISGVPTQSGFFQYFVTATICPSLMVRGYILVKAGGTTINLTSEPGTDNQNACIDLPITNISYIITGVEEATVIGLPPGVTGIIYNSSFIINGAPTEEGTFNYTVEVTGSCSQETATGTITVSTNSPTLTGLWEVCSYDNIIYTTEAGKSNYVWYVPPGGTIIAGGTATSNTVTVSWNTPGDYILGMNYDYANGCNNSNPIWHNVHVKAPILPSLETQYCTQCLDEICQFVTEQGMSNYIWAVSSGGTIVDGGTPADYFAVILWNNPGAQSVSVNYMDTDGCTGISPTVYNVDVKTAVTAIIVGPEIICGVPNVGNFYSVRPGLQYYNWWINEGGTITAGETTNAIIVRWNTVGEKVVFLRYEPYENECFYSSSTSKTVTVSANLPVAAGLISGPIVVTQGQTGAVYSVAIIPGATGYNWELPSGAIITEGANTNIITVSFGYDAVSGIITVAGTDGVCSGPVSPGLNITVIPGNTTLTGDVTNTECFNAAQTMTVAGGSNTFTVMSGGSATMIAGQNILYEPTTKVYPGGYMHGYISNTFCGGNIYAPKVAVKAGQAEQPKETDQSLFRIYPNPTTGSFTLELASEPGKMPVKVKCYNLVGSLIMEENFYSGTKHELSLAGQKPGIYLVRVIQDGDTGVRKMIKQ